MVSVVTSDIVTALRDASMLRRHRRQVRDQISADLALRCLPALLDIPLFSSRNLSLTNMLATMPLLALRGCGGSGRSMAFLQVAWQWAVGRYTTPVVLLMLDQIDNMSQPPWMLVQQQLALAGLVRQSDRRGSHVPEVSCVLLVDAWETLPTERQTVWRDCLLSLPRLWPEMHVGVVVPETAQCEEWPGFGFITMDTPDEAMLQRWLLHLLPGSAIEPLLDALRPGDSQVVVFPQLVHVALICLLYTSGQFPASLSQMYDYAWQELERYASNRRGSASDAQMPTPVALMVGDRARYWYRLAHDLMADGDLAHLAGLADDDRCEVAALLASMLPDPQPLYQVLGGADPQHPCDVLGLGRCLALRPTAEPIWSLRVLIALAAQNDGRLPVRGAGHMLPYADYLQRQLLRQFTPHLSQLLIEHGHAFRDDIPGQLLVQLAPVLGATRLLELLDNPALHPALRWLCADALGQMPPGVVWRVASFQHPPDALAQAARCYLLACDDDAARQSLGYAPALEWIAALAHADIDPQRRDQVVAALFEQALPLTTQLAALASVSDHNDPAVWQVLLHACVTDSSDERQMALALLHRYAPERALLVLGKILFAEQISWEARQDALDCLIGYASAEATILLARCVMVAHLPLVSRLQAMDTLAHRSAGSAVVFRRLLGSTQMHPAVRARAARLLGRQLTVETLHEVAAIASSDAPVLVRREALAALEELGCAPMLAAAVRIQLGSLLKQVAGIPLLVVRTVHALGIVGASESIALLGALLGDAPGLHLRAAWLADAPHLAELHVEHWPEAELPPMVRPALITVLAQGITSADHPGNLDDLVMRIAEQIRCAAAAALAQIGQRVGSDDRQAIIDLLFQALGYGMPGRATIEILRSLVQLYEQGSVTLLDQMLDHADVDPQICWLAIDQFGRDPATAVYLLAYLERNQIDAFVSSSIVRVLADAQPPGIVPVFCRLVEQPEQPLHVRIQAVHGLGQSGIGGSQTTLLSILADNSMPVTVRTAAADALPTVLPAAIQARLHAILQHERFPAEVTASIIASLGRTGDKEALPLLLRYIRHESPTVVIAALQALGTLGEAYMSAELVELTQRTTIDQRMRLQAVGSLLHLCGADYVALMRPYLSSPNVPLRLRAFELLLEACPHAANLVTIIADASLPLVMRLRGVEAAAHLLDTASLANLLLDETLDAEVGVQVVRMCGQRDDPDIVDILAECACSDKTPLRVRYYCIRLLAFHRHTPGPLARPAGLALSRLVDDPVQPEEQRIWAMEALFDTDAWSVGGEAKP